MNSTEFRTIQTELHISSITLAKAFDVQPVTVSRWRLGHYPVPAPVAMCIKMLRQLHAMNEDITLFLIKA